MNAIYLAAEMIGVVQDLQRAIVAEAGARGPDCAVPCTTAHVGKIAGGEALNIVPARCSFAFEIRNLPTDDPDILLGRLRKSAAALVRRHSARFPDAAIGTRLTSGYPALDTPEGHPAVGRILALAAQPTSSKLAFGTEGGLFRQALDAPVVICGPGSMEQGHKTDEYITTSQLAQCDAFLGRLVASLA